jgi:hypothetical protein
MLGKNEANPRPRLAQDGPQRLRPLETLNLNLNLNFTLSWLCPEMPDDRWMMVEQERGVGKSV